MSENCVTYHIDKEQKIVFLNDNWHSFASKNRARHLTSRAVLNKSIFTFITDESCRHLYQMLITRCKKKQEAFELSFRCDSPDRRRFMLMKIIPLESESTGFRSCIIREETRSPIKLLDVDIDRSNEFVTICSWCKQIRVDNDNWVEVEEAIERLELFGASPLPQLTHGLCPVCYEYVQQQRMSK